MPGIGAFSKRPPPRDSKGGNNQDGRPNNNDEGASGQQVSFVEGTKFPSRKNKGVLPLGSGGGGFGGGMSSFGDSNGGFGGFGRSLGSQQAPSTENPSSRSGGGGLSFAKKLRGNVAAMTEQTPTQDPQEKQEEQPMEQIKLGKSPVWTEGIIDGTFGSANAEAENTIKTTKPKMTQRAKGGITKLTGLVKTRDGRHVEVSSPVGKGLGLGGNRMGGLMPTRKLAVSSETHAVASAMSKSSSPKKKPSAAAPEMSHAPPNESIQSGVASRGWGAGTGKTKRVPGTTSKGGLSDAPAKNRSGTGGVLRKRKTTAGPNQPKKGPAVKVAQQGMNTKKSPPLTEQTAPKTLQNETGGKENATTPFRGGNSPRPLDTSKFPNVSGAESSLAAPSKAPRTDQYIPTPPEYLVDSVTNGDDTLGNNFTPISNDRQQQTMPIAHENQHHAHHQGHRNHEQDQVNAFQTPTLTVHQKNMNDEMDEHPFDGSMPVEGKGGGIAALAGTSDDLHPVFAEEEALNMPPNVVTPGAHLNPSGFYHDDDVDPLLKNGADDEPAGIEFFESYLGGVSQNIQESDDVKQAFDSDLLQTTEDLNGAVASIHNMTFMVLDDLEKLRDLEVRMDRVLDENPTS